MDLHTERVVRDTIQSRRRMVGSPRSILRSSGGLISDVLVMAVDGGQEQKDRLIKMAPCSSDHD